jgi:hypothetical protein
MAYLGNSPGVASQRVESAFTATSSQTVFTPSSGYTLGYCDVYQNGVKLVNGDDYTAADGATITLTTGAATGDSIVIVASFPRGLSDGYLKSEADAKYLTIASPSYTGTLTGGTGVVNLGSGQFYKDASGNVGIGTSSPATRLHVYGGNATVQSSTSGDGNIRLTNTGASYLVGMLGSASSTALSFYDLTNSAERMRIDSSGNLLVGTTGYIGGAGTAGLTSKTIASGHFAAAFEGYYGVGINAIPATGALMYFYYNGGGSPVGSIYTNGSSTSYGTSSDYRLKENVAPMSGALAKVAALKPCTYTWKATGESDEGFIAHELQEVCPSAVSGKKDAVNEDGSIKPQGIDTSFLVATLTAAIQEQQAIITQLQADVAALKGN